MPQLPAMEPFVAIDFETADYQPDSACAVGLVRVENGEVVGRETLLLRPPRPRIMFTHIHRITWAMVKDAPTFAEAWPRLGSMLEGAKFLAAHNASFDRRVLMACCLSARLPVPDLGFRCTVQISRKRWKQSKNDLATVCRRLGIALNHHDAGSDAEACARIVIAAHAPIIEECPLPLLHAHRSSGSRGPGI